jgi:hypothetical protein
MLGMHRQACLVGPLASDQEGNAAACISGVSERTFNEGTAREQLPPHRRSGT